MMASDILLLIISLSLAGSILYVMVLIMHLFFKNYIKSRWFYSMMKIAMIFFLFPSILIALLAWERFLSTTSNFINGADLSKAFFPSNTDTFGRHLQNSAIFIILLCIWLAGFIICYAAALFQELLLMHHLRSVSNECISLDVYNLCKSISDRYKINNHVSIYQSDVITSPFIVGIFGPTIFLPDKTFDLEVLDLILAHELWHYKSRDVLYKSVMAFISGLHWFNPIIYFFSISFSNYAEIACDEIVLDGCRKEKRLRYAEIIVNMINTNKETSVSVGMTDKQMNFTKRRLYYIMHENTHSKKSAILLMITLFVFACPFSVFAAVSTTAYAQDIFINELLINQSEQEAQIPINSFMEHTETVTPAAVNTISGITPRGTNPIDLTLPETGRVTFNTLTLSKGTTVKFVIGADNTSDSFRCGIAQGLKSTYVSSSNGTVNHTFTIKETGDYTLYLEGKSSSEVHVSGMITIKE